MDKNERKSMGKPLDGVVLPVAPSLLDMPDSYTELRDAIISRVRDTRFKVLYHANAEKNLMYWQIGNDVLRRQENEGWGAKVIDRLSKDLKEAFPDMSGFSSRNLGNMKKFAQTWEDTEILQQVVAKLPWRSIITLIDKLDNTESRIWYAKKSLTHGWSSNVLYLMIGAHLIDREGKAITNFNNALPSSDSDMAAQSFKDPYLFDFLGTADARREAEVEQGLVEHMEKFLLELGQGFAFVGRQVHLEVGGDDFYVDLLFYHLRLRCYIVIELKARDFEPGDVAQLSMYQNIVNKVLNHPDDKPAIGLLLVKGKNKTVVEYSMMGYTNPIGVADWQEQLTHEIPDDLKSDLPTVEEIERELGDANFATAVAKLANSEEQA
jgi:predicted nuclease of restriction endonuclease-like (RecB) superfamily